jgi:hypothetical protein
VRSIVAILVLVCTTVLVSAQQMPDPKKISGVPLPVADVPTGTVTVRVIRGQLSNALPGQIVELSGAGSPKTARTDEAGRAQFAGLVPGTRVKASVTVNGERIDSREFEVPATSGTRLMLVATDPETEKRTAEDQRLAGSAAVPGIVVLGEQTRFVIEAGDEALNVFNILQIVNTARTPVQTAAPLVFELPAGASGAGVLEGSAPNAVATPGRVTVNGPFAPGTTMVQFAYSLPFAKNTLTIQQKLPVPLAQFSLIVQKIDSLQLTSPQLEKQREMSAEGQSYIVGQGPALGAGAVISLTLAGLPHHAVWPRNLALALASAVLVGGVWLSMRRRPDAALRRNDLRARRERLFAELTTLEDRRREGRIEDARYSAKRGRLLSALEGVYVELDRGAAR